MNPKRTIKALICAAGLLAAALLAGCGSGDQGRDPILGVPAADLVSIVVTPATATVAIGATQQFTAVAAYTDGSAVDVSAKSTWTSATPALATVNAAGVATGISAGAVNLTAVFAGKSASAALTVLPARLLSIALVPATVVLNIGNTQQYAVLGTFNDNSTRDITAAATFSVAAPAIATVGAGGLATARTAGVTTVSAASSGLSASASLTVRPATVASLALTPAATTFQVGATGQLVATATYTDGSVVDVTRASVYTSATPTAVSVSASGLITGVAPGSSTLGASFGGQSASAQATTTPATITGIIVSPASATVNIGGAQQFTALATYLDGTSASITATAAWTSSSIATATVLNTGIATGLTAGASTITASAGGKFGSAILTVRAPAPVVTLSSLTLTPAATTFQVGATRQLVVTARYSDATVVDVTTQSTFASATPAAVGISAGGLINGVAAGTSVLSASFGGQSATAQATTTAVTITAIAVSPASASVPVGGSQQFIAIATYSDNTSAVITSSAAWSSSSTAAATVLNTGVATGLAAGSSIITASAGGQSGSGVLTVTALTAPAPTPVAAVNLRSAANFAVLAGTALTSNSGGTTLIAGNVGSPSQTTAPPVTAGFTNYQSGAILDTALSDLQLAITDAKGRTCDVSFAANIDLGGLVLPPGVYCYAGTISVTGTLTLNGAGVYIFRTAQTLNTTANSAVLLIGGATADNISWVPVGATTLGANSAFKGSVLGQSAAITVGDNTTLLNGRVLSGAAVTLSNNQIAK
ncbi:Ig-like domain-containing protein [Massilia sp. DWR3-1-1]|uniref:Ig-like domain-containing protein n=1 Tax=Massilia sp. DWR3-1-1 TaxID=2804559 RepID=UPI003CF33F46